MRGIFVQFGKYIAIAGGSAAVDWAIFLSLNFLFPGPVRAQMVARIGGGLFSFGMNKYFSFQQGNSQALLKETRRFLLLYAFSYVLSVSLMYLGVRILDLPPYWTKLGADSTCLVVNFLVMRGYVFSLRMGITRTVKGWLGLNKPAPESSPD